MFEELVILLSFIINFGVILWFPMLPESDDRELCEDCAS